MALAGAIVLLASCATTPRGESTPRRYLGMLPDGMTAYFVLDLDRTRDLVPVVAEHWGMATGGLESGLRRARALYAGLRAKPSGGPLVSAVAVGSFPTAGLGLSLTSRKGWRRIRGDTTWFENAGSGLQIAVVEPGVALVSNGGMVESLQAAARSSPGVPRGLAAVGEGADLAVFLPAPPPGIRELAGGASEAIRELWLTVARAPEDPPAPDGRSPSGAAAAGVPAAGGPDTPLDVTLGFRLAGDREATLFRPVLRLLLVGMARQGRLPGGMSALARIRDLSDGNVVSLAGIRLSLVGLLTLAEVILPRELEGSGG